MTYEEYKEAVYKACTEDAYVNEHQESLNRVFKEEEAKIIKGFKNGKEIDVVAWGLCLLVD